MGHQICAIVGKLPIDEEKLKSYELAVAYENNFAIVLLDDSSIEYWSQKLNKSVVSESKNIAWACELIFFFAKEIGLKKYGIIQTAYAGGIGSQCASLYEDGKAILAERSINEVLNMLGVQAQSGEDEFDTLNLGKYRYGMYYYWDEGNKAENRTNMIPGRIPK